jgi:hypothetical protein
MAAAAALRPQGLKASLRSMTAWRSQRWAMLRRFHAGATASTCTGSIKWQRLQHELVFNASDADKVPGSTVNRLGFATTRPVTKNWLTVSTTAAPPDQATPATFNETVGRPETHQHVARRTELVQAQVPMASG